MGNFGGNGAEGRSKTHVFSATDHRETRATASRRYMGYNRGGSSVVSGSNEVTDDLHRERTGNCGAVGRFATNI